MGRTTLKFKIGQKVRVKEWLDMPLGLQDTFGLNTCRLGEVGTILRFVGGLREVNDYDIIFEGDKYPVYLFEPEVEPEIAVGEQLLFDFMLE